MFFKIILLSFVVYFIPIASLYAQKSKVMNMPKYDYKKYHFGFTIGINQVDFNLVGTPHRGSFGVFLKDGLRLSSGRMKKPKQANFGFVFELNINFKECKLVMRGGNVLPPYDNYAGLKPDIKITLNGKDLYSGKSNFINVCFDQNSGEPVTATVSDWEMEISVDLLRTKNFFKLKKF